MHKIFSVSNVIHPIWSHASWVTNYRTFIEKLLAVCPKALARRRKRRKKKRMAIAQLFAFHVNAKKYIVLKYDTVLFSGNQIRAEK